MQDVDLAVGLAQQLLGLGGLGLGRVDHEIGLLEQRGAELLYLALELVTYVVQLEYLLIFVLELLLHHVEVLDELLVVLGDGVRLVAVEDGLRLGATPHRRAHVQLQHVVVFILELLLLMLIVMMMVVVMMIE